MSKRWFVSVVVLFALVGAVSLAGCKAKSEVPVQQPTQSEQPAAEEPAAAEPPGVTADVTKLKIEDQVVGTGAVAKSGDNVTVDYTGWLANGTKFESSLDSGTPYRFVLGQGKVIKGWDVGVEGMKVGGKRRLIIPPDMGYGDQGSSGAIPPGATLVFDVVLLAVN